MTAVSVRRVALIGLAVAVLTFTASAQSPTAPFYDVVIRNGHVLDGADNPGIRADIAIKGGRFVRVGIVLGRGRQEIDATGKYVSPGWIDMMDQSGSALLKNGLAENKLLEGVTTAIGGEGGTPVPAERIAEYFGTLERQGISINFGTYFSETQARVARARSGKPGAEHGGARAHGGDHGAGDAGRRHGNDDGAHLSPVQFRDDPGVDRGGEGGGEVRRHLREPHSRRR